MKITTSIIKSFINVFSSLIRNNKDIKKYLFTVSLKDELTTFFDNEYYQGYSHINKAISIARKYCSGSDIIIDVGGADGTTPIIFSRAFPDNIIYVFEPINENYSVIKKLIKKYPNIKLIAKAAGNSEGKSTINKASRITSSSIFELNADQGSSVFAEQLKNEGKENIEITMIDNVISQENTAVFKIDVQGFELEVLKGAVRTLKNTNVIVLEMNNHDGYKGAPKYYEIDEYLRNNNFTLYDIFPSFKDEDRLKEWDSIYLNNILIK
jgi:FkbM family methyltransferase